MGSLYVLTILIVFGSCRCFDLDAFDDISWNDVKTPVQNLYGKVSDKTNDVLDDVQDFFSTSRKRTPVKKLSTPDYNSVIETTVIRTSGRLNNNEFRIEVISYYELDIIWVIVQNGTFDEFLGDAKTAGNMFISYITLYENDINSIGAIKCYIPVTYYHFINLSFRPNIMLEASVQVLNELSATFNGPFSSSLHHDGTFEFDIELHDNVRYMPNKLVVHYGYLDTNQTSHEGMIFDLVQTELQNKDRGTTHILIKLGTYKMGEFVIIVHTIKDTTNFHMLAVHRVDIPRNHQPAIQNEVSFVNTFGEKRMFQFPPNIRYGALLCYAAGQPVPSVDIFKAGVKMETVSLPTLGVATTALVSFNGRSLDDVAGTYVCKATSGSQTIEKELLVVVK